MHASTPTQKHTHIRAQTHIRTNTHTHNMYELEQLHDIRVDYRVKMPFLKFLQTFFAILASLNSVSDNPKPRDRRLVNNYSFQ